MILSVCTSSTVHAAVFPAAVSPQVEMLRFSGCLCSALLRLVQRHRVLVMDTVCLIVEQENLGWGSEVDEYGDEINATRDWSSEAEGQNS